MGRVVREYEPGELKIALAGWVIHAGFESPATDYEENRISLDVYVSNYPSAVFYIKVTGNCMQYSGIEEGDLLIVDRSLSPQSGDVIIGVLNNEHILACYIVEGAKRYLVPDNPTYRPYLINELDVFTFEGVVAHSLLNQRNQNHVRTHRLQQLLRIMRKGISA